MGYLSLKEHLSRMKESHSLLTNTILDPMKKNSLANTPIEWRESVKVTTSVLLASGLWMFLGWLAYSQFEQSKILSNRLMSTSSTDKDSIALIDKAADKVNNTANSLYALLTPFATAVTGFFFASSNSSKSKEEVPPPTP
jgi:hypothetical protein